MVQVQIISKILADKSMSIVELHNIDDDQFDVYTDEYMFIKNHFNKYNIVPDKETFINMFPEFTILDVKDSDRYLVDVLNEEYLYKLSVPVITKAADLLAKDSHEAVQYLQSQLGNLQKKQSVIGENIIATAKRRYDSWLDRGANIRNHFIPSGFPELDVYTGGWKRGGELVLIFARTGIGKEQPVSAKVLTPTGWKTMGEIQTGDLVMSGEGNPTKVLDTFPQGVKDVYGVWFSDGGYAECGLDHLWEVQLLADRKEKRNKRIVMSLKQMLEKGIYRKNKKGGRYEYDIRHCEPVKFSGILSDSDIDPYVLGALLGDGGLTKSVCFTSPDDFIVEKIRELFRLSGEKYELRKTPSSKLGYRVVYGKNGTHKNSIRKILSGYGIFGKMSSEKFIPDKYKFLSIEQRKALLAGIMDTDGWIDNNASKACNFSSASLTFCQDVRELAASLGCRVLPIRTKSRHYTKDGIRVKALDANEFQFYSDFCPFTLPKKITLWKGSGQRKVRLIQRVEKIRQEESKCILVDCPSHTYITNDYVVTHNSMSIFKTLSHSWKNGYRVGLIEPEMSKESTGYRFDTIDAHFSNTALTRGENIDGYDEYTDKLTQSDVPIVVADTKDFDKNLTVSKIRQFIIAHKLDILGIDGITYVKDERRQRGSSITEQLTNIAEDLMELSNELSIPIIIVAQANREGVHGKAPELENVRYSDGIAHNASIVLSLGRKGDEVSIHLKKNRNGLSGSQVCYRWDIDHGIFEYLPEDIDDQEEVDNTKSF